MRKCIHHPGKDADTSTSIGFFCEKCAEQIEKAQATVRAHVEPKKCFIIYRNTALGWKTIEGTGCAHWVAHQRNIKYGASSNRCAEGFSVRVPDVIATARRIDRTQEDVKVNDIWAIRGSHDHCGLVISVTGEGANQKILIRHCASSHERGITDSDFATYLGGKGDFYRL